MADLDARVARLEAYEAIRSLAARHALAVDRRDLDALVALYVDDVACPLGTGRDALARWFDTELRSWSVTFHLVGGHVIDLVDEDRASGSVTCRAEYEVDDQWIIAALQHWDRYERRDERWYLTARETHAFYAADVLERPTAPPDRFRLPPTALLAGADLPEAWPSWQRFWGGSVPRRDQ